MIIIMTIMIITTIIIIKLIYKNYQFSKLQLQEEKIAAIQEKLELAEQKLAQYSKLPEIEEQLKQRMEALTQVRSQVRRLQAHFFLIDVLSSTLPSLPKFQSTF